MARVTRFAPSPTGPLHLGHALAAFIAAERGDRFLLRLEDIDQTRCKPQWEAALYDDLAWLGLTWETPVLRQSERQNIYQSALNHLGALGLTYHCNCKRADIRAALSAPQEGVAVEIGPDGPVYPGLCREKHLSDGAVRLNMRKAMAYLGSPIEFEETAPEHFGHHIYSQAELIEKIGDVVLARQDIGTSYHLAVVVDDAAQGITEITRGADLFEATALHVVLQRLLDLPTPSYHHHRLMRDDNGKRLAKRDDARALAKYRSEGASAQDIRALIGL